MHLQPPQLYKLLQYYPAIAFNLSFIKTTNPAFWHPYFLRTKQIHSAAHMFKVKWWTDQTDVSIHRAPCSATSVAKNHKQKSLTANFGLALMHRADQTVLCNESLLIRSLLVVSLRYLQANQWWKTKQTLKGTKV